MRKGRLSLSRKENQSIAFQVKDSNGSVQDFSLSVTDIGVSQVKLTVEAPEEVKVVRSELLAR